MRWPWQKPKQTAAPKVLCRHKYQDFPWYIESEYDHADRTLTLTVNEPYVCIFCGHRRDIELEEHIRARISVEAANQYIHNVRAKYAEHIKDRAIVENLVHDAILVDREALEIYKQIMGKQ